MRFQVASYRNGIQILRASGALDELASVLGGIHRSQVDERRNARQARSDERAAKDGGRPRKAGIQDGMNAILDERLAAAGWESQVKIFSLDVGAKKGIWTMDFAKSFKEGIRVGVEVTFNHAEAMPWTLVRPTLAHEAEGVLEGARIHVGVIIIPTDQMKGKGKDLRMDGAVGTYERLRTLLPKMRSVLPAPLVIIGLDWDDGAWDGSSKELRLHTSLSDLSADARI